MPAWCDRPISQVRLEGGAAAHFHLVIVEVSHNAVLLHSIRALFDLLKRMC